MDNEGTTGQDELLQIITLLKPLDRDARIRVLAAAAIFYGVQEDVAG